MRLLSCIGRALLVVLVMAVLLLLPVICAPGTASEAEIKKLEDSLSKAQSDRTAAQRELELAKSEQRSAWEQKHAIDNELHALSHLVALSQEIVVQYQAQVAEIDVQITDAALALEEKKQLLRERMRLYHENGNVSYLELLFASHGINDFFMRLDQVRCMLEYDQLLIDGYDHDRQVLEAQRDSLLLLEQKAEETYRFNLEKSRELEQSLRDAEAFIQSVESDVASATEIYAEALQAEAELNALHEEVIASLQKRTNSTYIGGELLWPLSSRYTTVSSGFGNRIHPVTGKPQFHTSIDIPAPYGTEIYAANAGTVVEAAYHRADGNYILIDHGGGMATFYSHLSQFAVSVGETVERGQVIGSVGMTGWATGYHLNFSVYENSKAVNPMHYFT